VSHHFFYPLFKDVTKIIDVAQVSRSHSHTPNNTGLVRKAKKEWIKEMVAHRFFISFYFPEDEFERLF
jgi:hypothetical protein